MTVLEKIFARKAQEVAAAQSKISRVEIERMAAHADAPRGFLDALRRASTSGLALIAEVKKASPSRGVIRADFDASEIATIYARSGAAALSVLTDEHYFQGSADNLTRSRAVSGLPCLRKDFIRYPYQVFEARAWGADAILLIVAALSDDEIGELANLARGLAMDVLVEVHSEPEAARALAMGEPLIGVNNRNLSNFETSLETSDRLLPVIARGALAVSESGLETRADLERVQTAGARAVLIGTTFCAASNVGDKVLELTGRSG